MSLNTPFLTKLLMLLIFSFQVFITNSFAQNVGINSTGAVPNENAMLDLDASPSNNKGLLLPRLSIANRDAITAPIPLSLLIYNTTAQCFEAWNGTAWVAFGCIGPCAGVTPPSGYGIVESSGKCWLDRNLGATQVATSSTDANAYGDLYQWGRGSDGHQIRTSSTTTTLSPADNPGHSSFIPNSSTNLDWRSPQNHSLWQGVNGINNPCPSGYRIPTHEEWEAERTSWSSNNSVGAFDSPLRLTQAGDRHCTGVVYNVNFNGNYWSSTATSVLSGLLHFTNTNAYMSNNRRADGYSVRCIKD